MLKICLNHQVLCFTIKQLKFRSICINISNPQDKEDNHKSNFTKLVVWKLVFRQEMSSGHLSRNAGYWFYKSSIFLMVFLWFFGKWHNCAVFHTMFLMFRHLNFDFIRTLYYDETATVKFITYSESQIAVCFLICHIQFLFY